MKNLLIPSGVVNFPGKYLELAQIVGGMAGVLEEDGQFECCLSFPSREQNYPVRIRGRLFFKFRCSATQVEDFCTVHYKVYPTWLSAVFPAVSLYLLFKALFSGRLEAVWAALISVVFISGIFVAVFLFMRHSCIRRFIRKLEGNN